MLSNSLDGRKNDPYGQDHVLDNLSAQPDDNPDFPTKDTYGLYSEPSSSSFDLQLSLENKLRENWDLNGSMEFGMTWKMKITLSRQRVCLLEMWGHHIDGIDYFGWLTPTSIDSTHHQAPLRELCRLIFGKPSPRQKHLTIGTTTELFDVEMQNCDELNPTFIRWLMGYPDRWEQFMPTETL